MSLSNYLENWIIDHMLRNQAFSPPATVYASLHSGDPGETGTNEVTGGSYARQAMSLAAASSGTTSNSAQLSWTSMPVADVKAVGLWDAATNGNHLLNGPLAGGSFSAAVDDTITAAAHGMSNGDKVALIAATGKTFPTGPSQWTTYYVINAAANTFQISTTPGGAAVDITGAGEGTYIKVKATNTGDTFQIAAGDFDILVD